ncbi:MAG: MFS transporter [Candidatus Adiutrix sp.]
MSLGLDYEFVGRINFFNQACYLFFSVVGGLLSTKLGPRPLIASAALLCGLSTFMLSMVLNKWILLVIISFQGAFTAISWIPMVELVSQTIHEKNRGLALGIISSGTSYGVILSGLLIPKILLAHHWAVVWQVFGIISLILGILSTYIIYSFQFVDLKSTDKKESQFTLAAAEGRLAEGSQLGHFSLLIALLLVSGFYLIPFQLYLTPFIESDFGGSSYIAGYCWTILGGVGLVSGFLGGLAADKFSTKKAMIVGYIFSAIAIVLFVTADKVWVIFLACVVFALIYNAIFGFHPTYVSKLLPPQKTAKLFGVMNLALGFGSMAGSYVAGYIKNQSGTFVDAYWLMLVMAIIAIVICLNLKSDRVS